MFLPSGPSAFTAAGNSADLPGVTIFGLKPCCAACVQKLAKVGGGSTDVTISTPAALKAAICEVKFSANGIEAAGVDHLVAALLQHRRHAALPASLKALPSESFGHRQPTTLLVGNSSYILMKVEISASAPQKK